MSKYRNRPITVDGERYDSRGEAGYLRVLEAKKAAGVIKDWRRGRPWPLLEAPSGRRVTLRPDYEVELPDGSRYCLDYKGGPVTAAFRIKAIALECVYPDVPLRIVRADGQEVPA